MPGRALVQPPAGPALRLAAALAAQRLCPRPACSLPRRRTHDLFVGNHGQKVPLDEEAQKTKLACKVSQACRTPL